MMEPGLLPVGLLTQHAVAGFMDWWRRIDESVEWQEHIFLGLAIAYAVIALIALVCRQSRSNLT